MCGMNSPVTAQGYSSGVTMTDINQQATKQADPVGLVNFLNKTCQFAKQRVSIDLNIIVYTYTNINIDARKIEF